MRHCLPLHCMCIGLFLKIYNSTVMYIVEFTYPLLSDEILVLAVRERERERMGITSGNGKGMGIKLG